MEHFDLNNERNSHTAQQPAIQQNFQNQNRTAGDP